MTLNIRNKRHLLPTSLWVGTLFSLGVFCGVAYAGRPVDIPEPSVLSLMGIGGAVALVVYIRNKRNK